MKPFLSLSTKIKENKVLLVAFLMHTCRILVGVVFVFSGFVKIVDPLGTAYKIQDYLLSFGSFFETFTDLSLSLSILLASTELLLGLTLLLKLKLKLFSNIVFFVLLVLSLFTLYVAIYNPVTDCGCFGDALVITNWQTFYKNIILLVLAFGLMKFAKNELGRPKQWIYIAAFYALMISYAVYAANYLPIIDFLPYKVGVSIPKGMEIPAGAPLDQYETTFIYEKEGVQKEFTLEDYPKDDSTWVFVDQKTRLLSKGYQAPIHNFSIETDEFVDITEDVLQFQGNVYLLVMYDLTKADEEGVKRAEKFYQKHKGEQAHFYVLTGSPDFDVNTLVQRIPLSWQFCKTDPTTLKTMIRSNPGIVKLQKGVIVEKWHWRSLAK